MLCIKKQNQIIIMKKKLTNNILIKLKVFALFFLLTHGIQFGASGQSHFSPDSLSKHVHYFASEQLRGRETGKEGQKLAAHYIADYFERFGLIPAGNSTQNPYFQEFMVYRNIVFYAFPHNQQQQKYGFQRQSENFMYFGATEERRTKETLCFTKTCVEYQKHDAYLFVYSQTIQSLVDTVSYLIEHEDKNKFFILLADSAFNILHKGYLRGTFLFQKQENDYYRICNTDKTVKRNSHVGLPITKIIQQHPSCQIVIVNSSFAQEYGYDDFMMKQTQPIDFLLNRVHLNDTIFTENVLGYLKGSGVNQEVLVLGAHYDHIGESFGQIFFGADDNASGTAAIIELARVFSEHQKRGLSLDKSVLFIAFSAEEIGLLGSKLYVHFPVFPLEKTIAMLNMDMIGRKPAESMEKHHCFFVSFGKNRRNLKKLVQNAQNNQENMKAYFHPGFVNRQLYKYGSDHYWFYKKKIPIGVFFTGIHEDYHKPTDTADKVNYENLSQITQLIFETAKKLH
jgi:hypothetical protein